jgi:hypothetical protein
MLSSGMQCYHLGRNANVTTAIILKSGANVIIWCYHVMLSSGMITPLFFIFPGNFTHSFFSSRIILFDVYFHLESSSRNTQNKLRRRQSKIVLQKFLRLRGTLFLKLEK